MAAVLGLGVVVLFVMIRTKKSRAQTTETPNVATSSTGSEVIKQCLERNREYLVYVGVPVRQPARWTRVTGIDGEVVITAASERVPLAEIGSFILAYPNGEIFGIMEFSGPSLMPSITSKRNLNRLNLFSTPTS